MAVESLLDQQMRRGSSTAWKARGDRGEEGDPGSPGRVVSADLQLAGIGTRRG